MVSIKQYSLGGCSVGITDGRDLWDTDCMIHVPSFMMFGSGIQVMIRLLKY
jgi:hypothetical protein